MRRVEDGEAVDHLGVVHRQAIGGAGQRRAPSSRETPRAASATAPAIPRAGPRGRMRSVSPTTPMAPTAWPEWSKIGAGHARLAEHRLVALARDAALARRRRAPCAAPRGVSVRLVSFGGASASRSSSSSPGAKARIALPSALACTGSSAPDLEDLERRVGPEDVVHDDDASAPCITPTRTAASRALGEPLGVDDRAAAQLVEVEVGVAELQQAGAELVLVGVAVLLDEAVRLQRLQQAVDRGARQLEPVGELADAEPPRAAGQRLQDARGAVDRLDRPPRLGRSLTIRHCRIHFDSVE